MIPEWLSDDALARTEALGREMAIFLRRRHVLEQSSRGAKVEPHQQLLELIAAIGEEGHNGRGKPGSTDRK